MKNSKILLGLAAAGISFVCGACQDGNTDTNTEIVPVAEQILFEEIVGNNEPSDMRFKNLFEGCYRNEDIGACQSLLDLKNSELFVEKVEKMALMQTLVVQQKIMALQAIEIANTLYDLKEQERRRIERKAKRRQCRQAHR